MCRAWRGTPPVWPSIGRQAPILLRSQAVAITPSRVNAGLDILFGNLGQDFVDRFESVSLDFSTMTFSLGAPRTIR